jgi:hypothetical protein
MYIYSNTCSFNNGCESGYSLYFPCVGTLTRGENACFDFYIVDNATKEEVDLREIDDITLNISGRYNCNFGSYSYPENIKSSQVEKFSELVCNVDFADIINQVKLYIDIVDDNHNLIESFLFDENFILDIAIEGVIGYFLNGSNKNSVKLIGYDTKNYIFLGWDIDEDYEECDEENRYNFLISNKTFTYEIVDNLTIRAVYKKRREYTIRMDSTNYNSSFDVEYMGEKTNIQAGDYITALEGHEIKVSCIPNDVKPYNFVKWSDGYKYPHRVLKVEGDNDVMLLKAYCELNNNYIKYDDNIDVSLLNNFKTEVYPDINDNIFVENYYYNNIYINKCEIDVLNDIPYVRIIDSGYIQIKNIDISGNLKFSLNSVGEDCILFIDNYEIFSSAVENNVFVFEFDGGMMTLMGNGSCIFGFNINKEVIYNKGKCMICLKSDETMKLHPGDIVAEGGVIVNGNPYGISPVKFATVTNVAPLIIK